MRRIYSLLVKTVWLLLHPIAWFQPKIKRFVQGRKGTFGQLKNQLQSDDSVLWMHVASLGEYEQGLPLLEKLKGTYADHKILLTFFSPSGYEVKKEKTPADMVTYLPMDTSQNAREFLRMVRPKLAIFVKYEIWPNYLHYLKENRIPTLLISGIFQKSRG